MSTAQPAAYYDADYFAGRGGKSNYQQVYTWDNYRPLFEALAALLIQSFPQARSYLDVGCAKGFLVQALHAQDKEAWGIEHSAYCLQEAHPETRDWLIHGSITEYLAAWRYDMVLACESLEHMDTEQVPLALAAMASHATLGCFATIPTPDMLHRAAWKAAQREPSHVTLRPRAWWHARFQEAGFIYTPFHRLAEQYFHQDPIVARMGWNCFCLGAPNHA